MKKKVLALAAVSLLGCGGAAAADLPAFAQAQTAPTASQQGWSFAIAPYGWMAGLSGDVSAHGSPQVHLDADFSRILDSLDFVTMIVGEARYGRFIFYSDLLVLKLSTDVAEPRGIPVNAKVGSDLVQWTPMAGYSLIRNETATLDVMVGARLWSLDTKIAIPAVGLSVGDSESWVDAMAGVKGQVSLTDNVFLAGWAMAGAGGSDYAWDLMASIGYQFNDTFSAMLGYRAQKVSYENGSLRFKATIQGPALGLVARF